MRYGRHQQDGDGRKVERHMPEDFAFEVKQGDEQETTDQEDTPMQQQPTPHGITTVRTQQQPGGHDDRYWQPPFHGIVITAKLLLHLGLAADARRQGD
jgi:hypothetical protein